MLDWCSRAGVIKLNTRHRVEWAFSRWNGFLSNPNRPGPEWHCSNSSRSFLADASAAAHSLLEKIENSCAAFFLDIFFGEKHSFHRLLDEKRKHKLAHKTIKLKNTLL